MVYKTTTRGIHKADDGLSVSEEYQLTQPGCGTSQLIHIEIVKLSLQFPKP